jgi:Flp pilus assembly protein TadG
MSRRQSQRQRQRGQALTEFVLVAPIFFLFLFAIIEAGRFIFFYETLSSATRDGARYAIVNGYRSLTGTTGPADGTLFTSDDPTGEDVVDKVRESALGISGSAITVDRCWWYTKCAFKVQMEDDDGDGTPNYLEPDWQPYGDGNFVRGATVTVRATYTYSTILPLPLPNITVQAESSLVINN